MIELCPKCGAEEITDGVWRCNSYSSIMGFAEQGEHCKDRATLTARESELAEAKVELQDAYDVCAKLDADCREAKRRVAELEDMHRKIVDGIEWTMTNIADDMRCATPETDPWCKSLKRVHDLLVAVRKALLPPDRITHIPGKEDHDGEMH